MAGFELVGSRAFALVTDAAAARVGLPTETAAPIVEAYEHSAPIHGRVLPLRES